MKSTLQNWSIRTRVFAAILASVVLALILATVGMVSFEKASIEDRARALLNEEVNILLHAILPMVDSNRAEDAREALELLKTNTEIRGAYVFLPDGSLFTSFSTGEVSTPKVLLEEGYQRNGNLFMISKTRMRDGEPVATLVIVSSLAELQQRRQALFRQFWWILPILLLTGILVANWLQHSITRPILELAGTARSIAVDKDYSLQAAGQGADELAGLADDFNRMLGTMHNAEGQLTRLNALQESILQTAAFGIISFDLKGIIRIFNKSAERITGRPASSLIGLETPDAFLGRRNFEHLAEYLGGSSEFPIADLQLLMDQTLPSETLSFNTRLDTPRGAVPVRIRVSCLLDQSTHTGFLMTLEDLTEISMKEEERNRLVSVIEATSDLVALIELDGSILYMNSAGKRLLQLEGPGGSGTAHLTDFMVTSSSSLIREKGISYACMHGEWHSEVEFKPIHGRTLYGAIVIIVHRDQDGNPKYLSSIIRDITEQKESIQHLEANRIRLEEAQKHANVGSWEHDPRTGKTIWSSQMFKIFNHPKLTEPPDGMKGFFSLIHPADRPAVRTHLKQAELGTPSTRVRFRALPDGAPPKKLEGQTHVERDAEGRIIRYVGTVQDITDRVESAATLQRYTNLLDQTQGLAHVGGWELDLETNELYWSKEIFEIHEVDPQTYFPAVESAIDFYIPADRPRIQKAVSRAIESNEPYDEEFRITTAKGRTVWIRTVGHATEGPGGQKKLIGAFMDIDSMKRSEATLQNTAERLSLALEAARLGTWSWNLENNEVEWSDRVFEILDVKGDDFVPSQDNYLQLAHPEDRDELQALFTDALEGRTEHFSHQHRISDAKGEQRWIESHGKVFRSAEGTPVRISGTLEDITNRRTIEEELRHSEEQLRSLNEDLERRVAQRTQELEARIEEVEKLNESLTRFTSELTKSQLKLRDTARALETSNTQIRAVNKELEAFSYSVSHDLRSPLRHISGYVDLLRSDLGDNPGEGIMHCLENISGSAERMGHLIDDLLSFSRIGRQDMVEGKIDTALLLREVLKIHELEIGRRSIRVEIGDLPTVRGDSSLLRQVFENILDNAIKYTRKQATPLIKIQWEKNSKEDPWDVIRISDNGIGFKEQYEEKMFGVFQRLHTDRDFDGTGIGLATVRRILNRHHGRIWAEGRVNEGATFFIAFPREGN